MRKTKDGREIITYKEAVARLPKSGDIHTFIDSGPVLIGADWPRRKLLRALENAVQIELSGPTATAMKHGIAFWRTNKEAIFVETAPVTGGER